MWNRFIAVVLLFLGFQMLEAQDTNAEFERELAAKSLEVETIICGFTQVRSMAVLASDVIGKGKFIYSRPGNILLAFDSGDYIKMTDARFSMKNGSAVTEVKVNSNPMLKELRRILAACMTGDIRMMASGFNMNVVDEGKEYAVKLTPLKGRGAARMNSISMMFEKSDMSLSMLKLEDASGDSIRYDFYDKKFNLPVEEGIF